MIDDYRQTYSEHVEAGIHYWKSELFSSYGIDHGFVGADINVLNPDAFASLKNALFSEAAQVLQLRQVHGVALVAADEVASVVSDADRPQADGAFLYQLEDEPKRVLGVRTADCAPVLLSSYAANYIAALHCGWRSAAGGLLGKAVQQAREYRYTPEELVLTIGPCAGPCCYEVGAEFVDELLQAEKSFQFKEEVFVRNGTKYLFDLQHFLLLQAESVGIPASQLSIIRLCTICDKRFFSFRRQKADAGRQFSYISNSPAAFCTSTNSTS